MTRPRFVPLTRIWVVSAYGRKPYLGTEPVGVCIEHVTWVQPETHDADGERVIGATVHLVSRTMVSVKETLPQVLALLNTPPTPDSPDASES